MSKKKTLLVIVGLIVLALILSQVPPIKQRLSWRVEIVKTYLRGIIYPAGPVPTAMPSPTGSNNAPTPTSRVAPTAGGDQAAPPTATPEPLPAQVSLPVPEYELQGMNNCGPATLTMALRYYGWDGNQYDISDIIKPVPQDRNVNPDEMAYYVRNYAGWLRAEYRVGGTPDLLKRLLAAGYPVIIEETFHFDTPYWPNDDLWAAHYMLLTAYDDASRVFTGQDSFYGPDQPISYDDLDENWRPFNYVYMLIYLPDDEAELQTILGADWDEDANRQNALAASQAATASHPDDAFAWFNLGTNLLYFERYTESADAYDTARNLGLPQRMLRYQFGPFITYFQANRIDDLLTLTQYALQRTPNSEEALLWRGWARYRQGDIKGAVTDWESALHHRPGYPDAQYALDFVRN
ncbi:MAG: tetratricopeptide repeat protein [Chloroflexi bacterium]|nr:tetratricopeptide repeat protein [Chloroflexota bacterium]